MKSQSSAFKALYKRSNLLLLPLSTVQTLCLYKQNSLENTILNGIAQSAVKICQRDLLKVSALECSTKGPMNCSFQKAPFAR